MRVMITDQRYDDYSIEQKIMDQSGLELVVFRPPMDWKQSLGTADALMVDQATITVEDLDYFKGKVICRYGTGCDNVPVAEAEKRGIKVIPVPDYCTEEVADHVLAMILSCARHLQSLDKAVRNAKWNEHTQFPIRRLSSSVLGIIGFGKTGQALAIRGGRLFSEVIVFDRKNGRNAHETGVRFVSLENLFKQADFISLHIPANDENKNFIDGRVLALMKKTAFLINTARGSVIDDSALLETLQAKRIAGAALDVFTSEPPVTDNPYFSLENVLLTDHCAYYSVESFEELHRRTAENAVRGLIG